MKIFWLLFLSLFFTSCFFKDEISLKEKSGTYYANVNMDVIDEAKVTAWRVGSSRRQKISRGVRLKIHIPRFDKKSLKTLSENLNVDSWILKVVLTKGSASKGSELFSIPLLRRSKLKGKDSTRNLGPVDSTYLNVHYAASALSSDFAKLACPKLEHDKVIDSYEIKSSQQSTQTLRLSKFSTQSAPGRVQEFNFQGNTVNGGYSLVGEYHLEMALYDSKKQALRSNFIKFENYLEIKSESQKEIKGCP